MESINLKTGIYKSTRGDFTGAALFIMDISDGEDNQPVYLTIFNPENNGVHEITPTEWQELAEADGLEWQQEIPLDVKDQFLNRHSFAHLQGLND
ncbi:hypothetical protein [Thiomicrorhabdus indica]|uniref:hypothetical protein n=1 Tax=Thiomicrorhabdus indica TaxID=2267253 RepID=UPI00102DBCF9|nr:hypothetical protein [Thiomicrorhabdus indica]